MRKRLSKEELINGVLGGDTITLSRAITLIESALLSDRELSEEVLNAILPKTGKSIRIGITGVPGVGKSTFIESFGSYLCEQGHKVAVLAIDPSSQKTSGSILGDKTRMEKLAHHPNAFIRPSPTGTSLGGVANKTRETMLLCEAAGFDVILIETVGVGQSETAVKGMVDFFLLLMLAGAGDELQGIKKGIMEMADGIAITKADGENVKQSKQAKNEYQNALHLFPPSESGWYPKVLICSAVDKMGLDSIWEMIEEYKAKLKTNGYFDQQRKVQNVDWMNEAIRQGLLINFYNSPKVVDQLELLKQKVADGKITPQSAARKLLQDNSNSAK
ncbi:methylmalonyl Co-A mutase-associated GTPase MeaB [Fulvivirga lutea]|uniref:Methylmalonyl Co-A mutase-associated GTPase MeaB n=1 Tax=Fulvivirga lutea TaxID=2810512 RepID=A0A974WIX4_9BACT|nr:methylmalonyl Co-A mutase-associated GTPase MeaB [Fulvivirga lutea]QSE99286.1 methylmalonyl Co-A mutase-associated GTPase MeaB [Fulvivirga lutea]